MFMINATLPPSRASWRSSPMAALLILQLFLTSSPLQAQFVGRPAPSDEQLHTEASLAMQQGNYAIAYCIWQPMATNGDSRAQYNIGWMYHNGYGLSINDEQAFSWWLSSAASGDADSHFALGDLYLQGQGVEKDLSIALGWYISAALKGHEPSQEALMSLLSNDDGSLAQDTFQLLLQTDWSILGDAMQVKVDKANTRRGPDKSYQVVVTLEKGHTVIPLREQNGWTHIGITGLTGKGQTAWIFSSLLGKPAGIYPLE